MFILYYGNVSIQKPNSCNFLFMDLLKPQRQLSISSAFAPGTAKNKQRDGNPKGDRRPEESTAAGQWKLRWLTERCHGADPLMRTQEPPMNAAWILFWCLSAIGKLRKAGQLGTSWGMVCACVMKNHFSVQLWCTTQHGLNMAQQTAKLSLHQKMFALCLLSATNLMHCHFRIPKALILRKPTQQTACTKNYNTSAGINQSGPPAYDNAPSQATLQKLSEPMWGSDSSSTFNWCSAGQRPLL